MFSTLSQATLEAVSTDDQVATIRHKVRYYTNLLLALYMAYEDIDDEIDDEPGQL